MNLLQTVSPQAMLLQTPSPRVNSVPMQPPMTTTTTGPARGPGSLTGGLDPQMVMGAANLAKTYGPKLADWASGFFKPEAGATLTPSGAYTSSAPEILRGAQYGDFGVDAYGGLGAGDVAGLGSGAEAAGGGFGSFLGDTGSFLTTPASGFGGSLATGGLGALGTMGGQYATNALGYRGSGIGSNLGGMAGSMVGGYFGGPLGAAGGGFVGSVAGGLKENEFTKHPERSIPMELLGLGPINDLLTLFGI